MSRNSFDVAIIGGGLIGCFSAYFLRRRGVSVVVIEKGRPCRAASALNFGNLRLQGRDAKEFPLSLRAQSIWEDLARLTGEVCGVVPSGHLYLGFAPSDEQRLEEIARSARAAGLDTEILDGSAARRRWPVLSAIVTRASWSKRDAIAEPALAAPAVVRLALRAGAALLEHSKVVAVERAGSGLAVRTAAGGRLTCGHVVNAAGAWAGEVAGQLGEPVAMFAAGPPLLTIAPQRAYAGPSLHALDGSMLLRGGRGGEAVAGFFPRVKADLATGTAAVPQIRIEKGLIRLAEVAPGLGRLAKGRVWSGAEGYLPDMLPVIGWSQTMPGLFHAFGFSGHGYQLAPAVGGVVADLIVAGRSETPIDAFSIARFAGGVIDKRGAGEFEPDVAMSQAKWANAGNS